MKARAGLGRSMLRRMAPAGCRVGPNGPLPVVLLTLPAPSSGPPSPQLAGRGAVDCAVRAEETGAASAEVASPLRSPPARPTPANSCPCESFKFKPSRPKLYVRMRVAAAVAATTRVVRRAPV